MTDDTYSDAMRAGLRVVLRQQRVDVTDYGSLARVSVEAGLNKRFLSQFLSGETKSMTIEKLHKLMLHLGITEAECYQ